MKNIPITLTLPEELVRDLHLYISNRQVSKFVAQLVEEGIKIKKEALAREFQEANHDEDRTAEANLWDATIRDGLDETNEY